MSVLQRLVGVLRLPERRCERYFSGGRTSLSLENRKNNITSSSFDVNPPKGTRDFYPESFRQQKWIYDHWRKAAISHGFEEYDAPVVEHSQLYIRKSGEDITQQIYSFADKSGRQLCLRPEMTPTLARMVMAKRKSLKLPIKWFSIPQCWRYEKMTKGRRREHYQWNVDIWGVAGVEAEAEILSVMISSLEAMGLSPTSVGIRINSRKIVNSILCAFGVPDEAHMAACMVIDKWNKLPEKTLKEELSKALPNLSDADISKLIDIFNTNDFEIISREFGQHNDAIKELDRLFQLSQSYGFRDWLQFDATTVRGLSYYSGIVFEAFDRERKFRALCGGGRYNRILDNLSGEKLPDMPAVGFGFGDAVVVELLKSMDLLPNFDSIAVVDVLVCCIVDNDTSASSMAMMQNSAIQVATRLRKQGIAVDLVLENKRAKWLFQRADRLNAEFTLMFAPEEEKKEHVVLKHMKSGMQKTLSRSAAIQNISETIF